MNSTTFFTYFKDNNQFELIQRSLQSSEFTDVNSNLPIIIKNIMSNYKYTTVNCQQNGLPNTTRVKKPRKISYCADFDLMIINFYAIFGYELCKYLTIRKNMIDFLEHKIGVIDKLEDIRKFNKYCLEWLNLLFGRNLIKFDKSKLSNLIQQTKFYELHKTTFPLEIKKNLIDDLSKLDQVSFIDVKKETLTVFKLLLDCSYIELNEIRSFNDLLIETKYFDVLYNGSFLKQVMTLYEQRNILNYTKTLTKYEISDYIDKILKQSITTWLLNLVNKTGVKVNSELISNISEAIIHYFVVFSFNLAKEYNIILGFDKTSRIHFKTVFSAILQTLPTFSLYTPTQLTLIHYSLMTESKLKAVE